MNGMSKPLDRLEQILENLATKDDISDRRVLVHGWFADRHFGHSSWFVCK